MLEGDKCDGKKKKKTGQGEVECLSQGARSSYFHLLAN